jgi:hypothetical protein
VAIEWIERLRALIFYWKSRHKIDAKQEIELAQACRPRLTPQTRICRDNEHPPEAPPDLSALYPAMNNLYNWCVLEGCNPIVKVGRIYMKKGLHGQYKYVIIKAWLNFMLKFFLADFSNFVWLLATLFNFELNLALLYIHPSDKKSIYWTHTLYRDTLQPRPFHRDNTGPMRNLAQEDTTMDWRQMIEMKICCS